MKIPAHRGLCGRSGLLRLGQPVKQTAVEECDIENVGTRKFLKEVDYAADTAYSLSPEEIELMRNYLIVKD